MLGEGAGVVVLEELEHAKKRGARIYAEVAGYGATGDAYHITSPCEDGSGAAKAMELAIKEAGISPSRVHYINAGQSANNSTKSMIGHLLGAAGGVEFIVCVKSIQEGFIHRTMGTVTLGEGCDLNYAIDAPVEKSIGYVLSNSLGFGGHNASILLKAYSGN